MKDWKGERARASVGRVASGGAATREHVTPVDISPPREFGRYQLVRRIAVGGMAQLWLAVQRGPHGFEKTLVLKVILPEFCTNDDFVQMFLDEARLAATLDHSNVVRVYDFGEVGGQYYLAMEYLPGEDLAGIRQMARRTRKPLPIDEMCDVVMGAAAGLHFAHEATDAQGQPLNVVHRDVSPSNIIVTYHGTVKLVDFGIARAESNLTRTVAGTLKGKVAYVSPEQAAGEAVDRRSDVFSLGVVLFEMLTGRRPFKRDSDLATLKAVLAAPVPPPSTLRPKVPEALDAIVLKAMSRDLGARYQTAAELGDDLGAFLASRGYVRSDRALAAFMTRTFDAERRQGKLRITLAPASDPAHPQKTPSLLGDPQHLSPIRGRSSASSTGIEAGGAPRRPGLLVAIAIVAVLLLAGGLWALWPVAPSPVVVAVAAPEAKAPEKAVAPPAPEPEVAAPEGKTAAEAVAPSAPEPEVAAPPEAPTPTVEAPPGARPTTRPRVLRGRLTLDTSPWTEVYLKGRKLGDTPLVDFSLPVGIHVLTVVNEQKGVRRAIEVEVQAGRTTVKKLKL